MKTPCLPFRRARRMCIRRARERGATLIEGLVSITIFSFGILAVVGMLSTHMSTASDARYRVEAAQYAESILAEIRLASPADRQVAFSNGGARLAAWKARLSAAGGLPMVRSDADRLQIDIVGNNVTGYNVTVTVRWRAPTDRNADPHQYVTATFI